MQTPTILSRTLIARMATRCISVISNSAAVEIITICRNDCKQNIVYILIPICLHIGP